MDERTILSLSLDCQEEKEFCMRAEGRSLHFLNSRASYEEWNLSSSSKWDLNKWGDGAEKKEGIFAFLFCALMSRACAALRARRHRLVADADGACGFRWRSQA